MPYIDISPRGVHIVSYEKSQNLRQLCELAAGKPLSTELFGDLLTRTSSVQEIGVRRVKLGWVPYQDGESRAQAAEHAISAGFALADTADLAVYFHEHPEDIEQAGGAVNALAEESRFLDPDKHLCVPAAGFMSAGVTGRCFNTSYLDSCPGADTGGVLVIIKEEKT